MAKSKNNLQLQPTHPPLNLVVNNKLKMRIDDMKTIDAIHFLLENQHRSGVADIIFWLQANKKHDFDTTIPVTPEIAEKTTYEKKSILHKKMALQSKNKK